MAVITDGTLGDARCRAGDRRNSGPVGVDRSAFGRPHDPGQALHWQWDAGRPGRQRRCVTDADSTQATGATVKVSTGYTAGVDTLGYTGPLSSSFDDATGTLTLSGDASRWPTYQAALRSVTFASTATDRGEDRLHGRRHRRHPGNARCSAGDRRRPGPVGRSALGGPHDPGQAVHRHWHTGRLGRQRRCGRCGFDRGDRCHRQGEYGLHRGCDTTRWDSSTATGSPETSTPPPTARSPCRGPLPHRRLPKAALRSVTDSPPPQGKRSG